MDSKLTKNNNFDLKWPETHFLPWLMWFDPMDSALTKNDSFDLKWPETYFLPGRHGLTRIDPMGSLFYGKQWLTREKYIFEF
jgi:hypothetical protein